MVLVQLRWTSDSARFRCKRSLSRCARWLCKIIFSGIAFTRDRTQHPCREDSCGRILASSLTCIKISRTVDGKITRRHVPKLISAGNKDLLISSLFLALLLEITSNVTSVFPSFDYWNENLKSTENTSLSLTRSLSRISLRLFPHDFSSISFHKRATVTVKLNGNVRAPSSRFVITHIKSLRLRGRYTLISIIFKACWSDLQLSVWQCNANV